MRPLKCMASLHSTGGREAIQLSRRLAGIFGFLPPRLQPAVFSKAREDRIQRARREMGTLHQIVAVTPAPRRLEKGKERSGHGGREPLHAS